MEAATKTQKKRKRGSGIDPKCDIELAKIRCKEFPEVLHIINNKLDVSHCIRILPWRTNSKPPSICRRHLPSICKRLPTTLYQKRASHVHLIELLL